MIRVYKYFFPLVLCSLSCVIIMFISYWQEGSGSEKESEVPEVMVRKIQKNPKAKGLLGSSRDDSKRQSVGSIDGCLSLLKNRGDGNCPLAIISF